MRRDKFTRWHAERYAEQALGLCRRLNDMWASYLERNEKPPQRLVKVALHAMTRYRRRLVIKSTLAKAYNKRNGWSRSVGGKDSSQDQ